MNLVDLRLSLGGFLRSANDQMRAGLGQIERGLGALGQMANYDWRQPHNNTQDNADGWETRSWR